MNTTDVIIILSLCVAACLAVVFKKLDVPGGLAGAIIACCMYVAGSIQAVVILAVFFVGGTAATTHKKAQKNRHNKTEHVTGKRNAWQVLANSGVAAIASLLIIVLPIHKNVLMLMMAASLASAASDTLSSELGTVYGKRFYNIITGKKDTNGLDGVVSIEGLFAGLAGSALIAMTYAFFNTLLNGFLIVLFAGFAGNLFDSFLGATMQRKRYVNNNGVNFLNTLFAALIAFILAMI